MSQPDRARARRLAAESLERGDAVGWFEELYVAAEGEAAQIPWADLRVNPNLSTWLAPATSRVTAAARWLSAVDWATMPRPWQPAALR